jgi:hypothetical protein
MDNTNRLLIIQRNHTRYEPEIIFKIFSKLVYTLRIRNAVSVSKNQLLVLLLRCVCCGCIKKKVKLSL